MPLDDLSRALVEALIDASQYEHWWQATEHDEPIPPAPPIASPIPSPVYASPPEPPDGEGEGAEDAALAFDRSGRSYDKFGRLRVERSNITKACVNEYWGWEIPGWEQLDLDRTRKYRMWRKPDELEKALPTFNMVPILIRHPKRLDDGSYEPQKPLQIGSSGSEAEWHPPYITNSLIFLEPDAIEDIESRDREQLSSSYAYKPVMEPGVTPEGEPYDGIMTEIHGNHIALVPDGRVGDDVVVGDAKPIEELPPMKKLSRKALWLHSACTGYVLDKLAQDQAPPDLRPLLQGVTVKSWTKKRRSQFAADLRKSLEGKLAQDASLAEAEEFLEAIERMEPAGESAEDEPDDEPKREEEEGEGEGEPGERLLKFLGSKLTAEDMGTVHKLAGDAFRLKAGAARDQEPGESEEDKRRREEEEKKEREAEDSRKAQAMDERLKEVAAQTEAAVVKRMRETRDAEKFVKGWVGELAMAMDSADAVYKVALETLKVDVTDVHPSAYKAILSQVPKPGERREKQAMAMAMDESDEKAFDDMFAKVTTNRLKHV